MVKDIYFCERLYTGHVSANKLILNLHSKKKVKMKTYQEYFNNPLLLSHIHECVLIKRWKESIIVGSLN